MSSFTTQEVQHERVRGIINDRILRAVKSISRWLPSNWEDEHLYEEYLRRWENFFESNPEPPVILGDILFPDETDSTEGIDDSTL